MQPGGKFAQSLETKQRLMMADNVIQSLEILRLPVFELTEFVTQNLCENPLLEIQYATGDEPFSEDFSSISLEEVGGDELEREDVNETQFNVGYVALRHSSANAKDENFLDLYCKKQTFSDMLIEEINALHLDERDARLCRHLVACLNRRGYFEDDVETLAAKCESSRCSVAQAVSLIQSLQPAGVGARSLQECLLLQLTRGARSDQLAEKLIKEGLPLLAANDMTSVASLLEVDKDEACRISEVVRNLNPIPSQGYYTGEQDVTIIPEAIVRYEGDACSIVMNDQIVPRLAINEKYGTIHAKMPDGETGKYINQKKNEAKRLLKALMDREKTLLRILRQVVWAQPQYFKNGTSLVPMKMADIAKELELNTSTVSRAIQGKYIICAAGAVELKSLFAPVAAQSDEGETLSADFIKKQIKSCIDAENPHSPLSDEDIRKALRLININISRRTVTKYRMALSIPSTTLRRRL